MRDPRAEATVWVDLADHPRGVRVLEPSPPAVDTGPWFADDPVAGGDVLPVRRVGSATWQDVCLSGGDTALVTFCLERWLGPWRRLESLPSGFVDTTAGLHALAEHVIAPVRHAANAKIGLRWTLGGFGTPFLPGGRQVRIERGVLLDGDARCTPSTLGEAADFVGISGGSPTGVYTPSTAWRPDAALTLEQTAAAALGDWFGFATSVLEQLREEAGPTDGPSRVQLWPEHFDVALTIGEANFGASPGDDGHPEPYLYVGPWTPRQGPFWNEPFGASLPYGDLLAAADQRATALAFLRAGRDLLA